MKLVKKCKDCAHYLKGGDCGLSPSRKTYYGEIVYGSTWWERGLLERIFFGTCGPLARNWKPKEASAALTLAELSDQELYGAIGRAWCHPGNDTKEVDATLAIAIVKELRELAAARGK